MPASDPKAKLVLLELEIAQIKERLLLVKQQLAIRRKFIEESEEMRVNYRFQPGKT